MLTIIIFIISCILLSYYGMFNRREKFFSIVIGGLWGGFVGVCIAGIIGTTVNISNSIITSEKNIPILSYNESTYVLIDDNMYKSINKSNPLDIITSHPDYTTIEYDTNKNPYVTIMNTRAKSTFKKLFGIDTSHCYYEYHIPKDSNIINIGN